MTVDEVDEVGAGEGDDAVEISVTVYGDGGTMVSMPAVDDAAKPELLRVAVNALLRALRAETADRRPVTCPLCGRGTSGVTATAEGSTVLEPCGHVVA